MSTVAELRRNQQVRDLAAGFVALAVIELGRLVEGAEDRGYSNVRCVHVDDLCRQIMSATEFLREPR